MTSSKQDANRADASLIQARSHRLVELLASAPFESLLLTSPTAVDYATGYRSVPGQIHQGYGIAALVTAQRTVLVLPAGDTAPSILDGISADDIVPYGRFYFAGDHPASTMSDRHSSYFDALTYALRLAESGRVGVEGRNQSLTVAQLTNDDRFINADEWVLGVRSIKLPGEQDLLRRAAKLAEDGIEAALSILEPGVTEQELATAVATAMVAGGGQPRFLVVAAGARSALSDTFPTQNTCEYGDLVRFDVGCQLAGYWSDIARTAVVGAPSDLQQHRYDALLSGLRDEIEVARGGLKTEAVFDTAVRGVEKRGLSPYQRHHTGHAIGLSIYEEPVIRPGASTPLAPGMVLCLETPYYELGWGGMMVEDTGVITPQGFELFTSIDRNLRVVAE